VKRRAISAPRAAALECLGPVELAAKAVMCAHLILGAANQPSEQTLWQSQSELKGALESTRTAGRLGPRLAGPSYSLTITRVLFKTEPGSSWTPGS